MKKSYLMLLVLCVLVCTCVQAEIKKFQGPLRVSTENPRYFTDRSGRAVYLTGSHVWNNLVDMGQNDPPKEFNYPAYLRWMAERNHNFIRLWRWELLNWNTKANQRDAILHVALHPWKRTGPGKALDGKPKFDLSRFNEVYFSRLKKRVEMAYERGIYVSVMLFEGWGLQFAPGAWQGHPFHPKNNINGIDGDQNKDGKGLEIHTLINPEVTALQEAYIRKVVDTVGNLDNVMYEISNENHPGSTLWQYHMIRFIKKYEKTRPKQHPVGMTFQYKGGENATLFKSPADWISPSKSGYRGNPPVADGRKVVLSDTDHLWGIGGNQSWVWKSFLRGHNPIFMDPYDGVVLGKHFDPKWDPIRRSMGYALRYANRMNLRAMTPQSDLASTKYCLADAGREYLVYLPKGGRVVVDLSAGKGEFSLEWFNPSKGVVHQKGTTQGGQSREFIAPFKGDAVLYICSGKK